MGTKATARETVETEPTDDREDRPAISPVRHEIDARGMFCPIPILLVAREMRKLRPGDRLEMIGDDPGIVADMPVWCEETGNPLLSLEQDGGLIRCLLQKATE